MPVDTASPSTGLTPRRRELLRAALHVVADEGLRGLTHRAVRGASDQWLRVSPR